MIIAHIKSPLGDRTEEWDDSRVAKDLMPFVEQSNAYVIAYKDQDGKEVTGVVGKYYWDIYEDLLKFVKGPGEGPYPELTNYIQKEFQEIGQVFRPYLEIEKQFLSQETVDSSQYDTLKERVTDALEQNTLRNERLMSILYLIEKEPATEPEKLLLAMIREMYVFTGLLFYCIEAFEDLLKGLKAKAEGENYSPLDYLKALDTLRQASADRKTQEQSLTKARDKFYAYIQTQTQGSESVKS